MSSFFKKLGNVATGALAGFAAGGPVGAVIGGGLALAGGSSGGGGSSDGGGGGANLSEAVALRRSLGTAAEGQVQPVIDQLSAANKAISDAQAGQEQSILDFASQIGFLTNEQIRQIQEIAQRENIIISQAAERFLGEDGIAEMMTQIQQSIPGAVENSQQQLTQLAAQSVQLQSDLQTFVANNQELISKNSVIADQLQGLAARNTSLIDANSLLLEDAGFTRDQQNQLFQQSQDLFTGSEDLASQAVFAREQELDAEEAEEREELQDILNSRGIGDGGAIANALIKLKDTQKRRRNTELVGIKERIEGEQFNRQQQTIAQGTQITAGQGALTSAISNIIQGGSNVSTGTANILQGAVQTNVASSAFGDAANNLIQTGKALIDQQGNLVDTQTGRILQAAGTQANIATGISDVVNRGTNIALTGTELEKRNASTVADLSRATAQNTLQSEQQVADVGISGASQILQNTAGVQGSLSEQALTGTSASIASAAQVAGERRDADKAQQDALLAGLTKVGTAIGRRTGILKEEEVNN